MPNTPQRRRVVLVCLSMYAAVVVLVLLSPIPYSSIVHAIAQWLASTLRIGGFGSGWIEFAANVLMFVPLGLLLALLFRRAWHGVVLALALSVIAEVAQIVIPSRQPSVRDIVANVAGAALGAFLAWLLVLCRDRGREQAARPTTID